MIKKIIKNIFAFCIGVFVTFLLIEIFLRCLGWYQNNKNLFTEITGKNKNEIRVLSLGDSMTTLGQNPFYPEQLQNILNKSLSNKKIVVFNGGLVQSSSGNILYNLEKNLDKYHPDIVTIMTGSNDNGSIKYEEFAGIEGTDLFSNLRIYKLYKFLLKNVQEKLIKMTFISLKNEYLVKLGNDSLQNNQINTAKIYFEKALQINPNDDRAHYGLGMVYYHNGEKNKGISYFKKAIALNPNNYGAYIKLGKNSGNNESINKKIWYLQQAIRINPKNPQAYFLLKNIYKYEHMDKQELELRKQILQVDPFSYELLMSVATYYVEENNIIDAIASINKAFTSQPDTIPKPIDIQFLAELYKSQGKTKEVEKVLDLLTKSSEGLTQNYRKMADILKNRGIILIAIQYPMRDVSPLKTMLKDTDSIFVDNERSFEEQVAKYGTDEYFVDNFAGDFGHLTAEGHRIVAENIANVILKQIFKVKK